MTTLTNLTAVASLALLLSSCDNPNFTLETDHYNPTWFWVKDKDGKELVFYRDGILQRLAINTNRVVLPYLSDQCPEPYKDIGAVSVNGWAYGAMMTEAEFKRGATVQYWMGMSIWGVEDGTHRTVLPSDVKLWTAQEPIVVKHKDCWLITFKGP